MGKCGASPRMCCSPASRTVKGRTSCTRSSSRLGQGFPPFGPFGWFSATLRWHTARRRGTGWGLSSLSELPPGAITDPWGWHLAPEGIPVFGTGKQVVPLVHVRDLATFVWKLATRDDHEGARYCFACDEGNVTWNALVKALAEHMPHLPPACFVHCVRSCVCVETGLALKPYPCRFVRLCLFSDFSFPVVRVLVFELFTVRLPSVCGSPPIFCG